MILMMNKLMRRSGAVWAAAEAAVARLPQLFLPPPPPVFCITICKIALLLSVFACMPSVLAQDIPLLTLQAKNIQVRAEWEKVGDAGNHFRLDGGTLVLTSTISGAGKPEGKAITVIVKVRDKFSTLNPSYKDLAVMVTIRAVIMGCRADKRMEFAKSMARESADIPNQIIMREGKIVKGNAIARRYTENGFNHIYLYTVSATHGGVNTKTFLTAEPIGLTEPTSLYESLDWDYDFNPPIMPIGWTWLEVNESVDCFAEEVKIFKYTQRLTNVPFVTGLYAGTGARVISVVASVSNNRQIFSLDDVELANALNELYTIKAINDDGKAFRIDGSEQKGDTYEYYANLTDGSTVTVQNTIPHEVIVANNCPPVVTVIAWQEGETFRISESDIGKVKEYVLIDGEVYTGTSILSLGISPSKGVESYVFSASDFNGFLSNFDEGDHLIKFVDHFLCGI